MPKHTFDHSMATSGGDAAWIESGTIVNVNVRNMTVDWVSQYSGKHITDIQIMTPYLHYSNGEGFTCVPEVGAIATVCYPSDEESPFIMGFLSAPEMVGAKVGDLKAEIKKPGVETEEDLPSSTTTQSGGSTNSPGVSTDAGFRAGRPILNPGDMLWQGRDENWIALRRGGVLQLGSTNVCQRAYIPVRNFIRDFCENWEVATGGGSLSWEVKRSESDPSGDAPTEFTLISREYAQDKKASIKVSMGSLNDAEKPPGGGKTFVELVIAPESIDASTGEVVGSTKYVLRIDKAGNTFQMQAGSRTTHIVASDTLTVDGDQSVTIGKGRDVKVGTDDKLTISGKHEVSGSSTSVESWGVSKTISAPKLRLGSEAAVEPVVLGLKLVQWLTSHTHAVYATPAAPGSPAIPVLPVSGDPSTQSFVAMAQLLLSSSVTVNK